MENFGAWCDTGCDGYDFDYDGGFDEARDRHELHEQVRYAAGLIVKLGGGTYRKVFARLYQAMGARLGDASTDQLHAGLEHARGWKRQLRNKVGLTWHNPNTLVLAEGPEISIKPVGIRRVSAGEVR